MNLTSKIKLLCYILLLATVAFASPPADNPPDICQQSDNLLPNCNFNRGTDGWHLFTEEGGASFSVLQGGGECHAPACPAGYIVTDNIFVGGLYQQVSVTAGNSYQANVVWLVFDSLVNDKGIRDAVGGGMGRKMGIDPQGGTDPRSPNVVWGNENTRSDCKICDGQEVVATAKANTLTIFLRLDDRWKARARAKGRDVPPSKDQFWIDDIGLRQVGGSNQPAPIATATTAVVTPTVAAPTATVEVPTPAAKVGQSAVSANTSNPAPITATVTITPTVDITATATLTAPEIMLEPITNTLELSPTQPAAVDAPILPPPTLTPSPTRPPTLTPTPFNTPAGEVIITKPKPTKQPMVNAPISLATLPLEGVGFASIGICGGGIFLILLFLFFTGLFWLYQLSQRASSADEAETDLSDDEDFIVEIVEE